MLKKAYCLGVYVLVSTALSLATCTPKPTAGGAKTLQEESGADVAYSRLMVDLPGLHERENARLPDNDHGPAESAERGPLRSRHHPQLRGGSCNAQRRQRLVLTARCLLDHPKGRHVSAVRGGRRWHLSAHTKLATSVRGVSHAHVACNFGDGRSGHEEDHGFSSGRRRDLFNEIEDLRMRMVHGTCQRRISRLHNGECKTRRPIGRRSPRKNRCGGSHQWQFYSQPH